MVYSYLSFSASGRCRILKSQITTHSDSQRIKSQLCSPTISTSTDTIISNSSRKKKKEKTMTASLDDGSAVYTPFVLRYLYDIWVLWLSNNYVWKCPTTTVQLPLFKSCMGGRHLDIGVGTGYYPAQSLKAGAKCSDITLLDLNPNSLHVAEQRILETVAPHEKKKKEKEERDGDVRVRSVVASALEPLPLDTSEKFNSISVFYLLHCLAGSPEEKSRLFDVVRPHLAADGVFVGTTILGKDVPVSWLGGMLMDNYNNKKRCFHNFEDSQASFEEGLHRNFEEVESRVVGQVMLFKARKPRHCTA